MKTAVVIQDSLRFLGGGELVCLSTCYALQQLGYHVRLISDEFSPEEIEAAFGMGRVMRNCEFIRIPEIGRKLSRYSSIPGLLFAGVYRKLLENVESQVIFVTRDPRKPIVLPRRSLFRFMYENSQLKDFWESYGNGIAPIYRRFYSHSREETTFLALSNSVADQLNSRGWRNRVIFPSYGFGFRPRKKREQVVQVTFLAPQKRLEDFAEVARRLPKWQFYLVGRDTERINRIYQGYATRFLASLPENVKYVESRIRQVPQLLEESKVYLHTGREQGMNIAVMEAMSAGCIPIAPSEGGASEVLQTVGLGFRYETLDRAVSLVEAQTELRNEERFQSSIQPSPQEIADRAAIFSLESYQKRIEGLLMA